MRPLISPTEFESIALPVATSRIVVEAPRVAPATVSTRRLVAAADPSSSSAEPCTCVAESETADTTVPTMASKRSAIEASSAARSAPARASRSKRSARMRSPSTRLALTTASARLMSPISSRDAIAGVARARSPAAIRRKATVKSAIGIAICRRRKTPSMMTAPNAASGLTMSVAKTKADAAALSRVRSASSRFSSASIVAIVARTASTRSSSSDASGVRLAMYVCQRSISTPRSPRRSCCEGLSAVSTLSEASLVCGSRPWATARSRAFGSRERWYSLPELSCCRTPRKRSLVSPSTM